MRLIDADKLLRVIDEEIEYGAEYADTNYQLINKGLKIARRDINCGPTIEAQPVEHGKWEDREVRGSITPYCTNCGNGNDTIYHYNYCPNCGAKMDGGKADG